MGWYERGAPARRRTTARGTTARRTTARRTTARRLAAALAATLLAIPALSACGEDAASPRELSMGTGNSTGVYYVLGRGYANLVAANAGLRVVPQVTGGPRENIDRVVAGEDDIGLCSLSWASDAITGQGAFRTPQPIRALARLYLNYTQVVVRSGITSLRGLRGRAISTGSPGSTGELAASRLLALAGLDVETDTRRKKISLDKSIEAMKAGTLDAVFWSGGLPTGGIQDLTRTLGAEVTLLDLGSYYKAVQERYPDVYELAEIDPPGYGLPHPIRTIAEPNMIVVNDAMEPAVAEQLTRVLMRNLPQLASVHPEGRNVTRALAALTDPVPLHSGALHWYRDNPDTP